MESARVWRVCVCVCVANDAYHVSQRIIYIFIYYTQSPHSNNHLFTMLKWSHCYGPKNVLCGLLFIKFAVYFKYNIFVIACLCVCVRSKARCEREAFANNSQISIIEYCSCLYIFFACNSIFRWGYGCFCTGCSFAEFCKTFSTRSRSLENLATFSTWTTYLFRS